MTPSALQKYISKILTKYHSKTVYSFEVQVLSDSKRAAYESKLGNYVDNTVEFNLQFDLKY